MPADIWSEAILINQNGGLTWRKIVCVHFRNQMALVDEENIENQTSGEPCSGLRKELKECILASDCVKMVSFGFKTTEDLAV